MRNAQAATDTVREHNYQRARLTLLGALGTSDPEDVRAAMTLTLDVLGIGERGDSELVWFCDRVYSAKAEADAYDLYAYRREDVERIDAGLNSGPHVHEFYPLSAVQVIEIGTALLNVADPWSTEIHEHVLKVITAKEAA